MAKANLKLQQSNRKVRAIPGRTNVNVTGIIDTRTAKRSVGKPKIGKSADREAQRMRGTKISSMTVSRPNRRSKKGRGSASY